MNQFLLFYILSTCLVTLASADSREFAQYCDLSNEPVVQITKDFVTGLFKPVEEEDDDDAKNVSPVDEKPWQRNLRGSKTQANRELYNWYNPITDVRECSCSEKRVYCPLYKQYCGIPHAHDPNQEPRCISMDTTVFLIRNTWLWILAGWFGMMVLILGGTRWGRSLVVSLLGSCLCCINWRGKIADHMLENDPEQANYLIARNMRRRQRALERQYRRNVPTTQDNATPSTQEDDEEELKPRKPTSLALRTRRYTLKQTDDDEDEYEDTCTICFAPLEEGERVGALSCHHDFHVECLKSWLSHRNVCPLCQTADVAVPQYDQSDSSHVPSGSSNAPSDSSSNMTPSEDSPSDESTSSPENEGTLEEP